MSGLALRSAMNRFLGNLSNLVDLVVAAYAVYLKSPIKSGSLKTFNSLRCQFNAVYRFAFYELNKRN